MPPGIYESAYAGVYRGVVNELARGYRRVVYESDGGVPEEGVRVSGAAADVGNIPNGYNRTCPLPRLLVRQQARVPVGQQVRQSGTFPTGRAQTALTIIRYQPSYSLPLLP